MLAFKFLINEFTRNFRKYFVTKEIITIQNVHIFIGLQKDIVLLAIMRLNLSRDTFLFQSKFKFNVIILLSRIAHDPKKKEKKLIFFILIVDPPSLFFFF